MPTSQEIQSAILSQGKRNFFDKLLMLPLFQGIGRNEFLEIAERIKLGFQTVKSEQPLVSQDGLCTELIFVLRGSLRVCQNSDQHDYVLTEWLDQPTVIEPEALFGLRTNYTRHYTTTTRAEILRIDKAATRDILFDYPTFRINYLNLLCMQSQQAARRLRRRLPDTVEGRFVHFLTSRCLRPAGKKDLGIKMTKLGEELMETRLNVSLMLHRLSDAGLLEFTRGHIRIENFEKLIQNVAAK